MGKETAGEKLCNDIIGKPDQKGKDGATKLREVVEWMNNRNEYLNENKSHLELIKEFNNEKE